ncbi:MAG: sulfite exporter TauE/SafE family protein [Chloroflexi bacterium]|nr:sulfite exporter TauE/SafE family protein [Chloroflexota bacterium]
MELTLAVFAVVVVISLLCEYVDASIGMGYGTTLTPVLLIIGFLPLEVVPAVLLGQLAGGLVGGFVHHKVGNVSLDFRQDRAVKKRLHAFGYIPRSVDSKVIMVLAVCGVVGVLTAIFFALNIPTLALKTYIGAMVVAIGVIILVRRNRESKLSWKTLVGIGLISSFNKGASGGGYGPLITGGQLVSGRETRSSIGSTTIAEALVCIVGFSGYLVIKGDIYWTLAAATSIGSIVAAPFAAITVSKLSPSKLKVVIGVVTCILGVFTLVKTFI